MRMQLNKLIGGGSLSRGEYLVLRSIRRSNLGVPAEGEPRIRAALLSEMLELSRPSITRILNTLEGREFITRNIDTSDRRSVSIVITQQGLAALEQANRALLGISGRLTASLGEEDTDKLIELVDKLAEIYKNLAEGTEDSLL
jgi:DNA-binding MarR family transcriptional regulator